MIFNDRALANWFDADGLLQEFAESHLSIGPLGGTGLSSLPATWCAVSMLMLCQCAVGLKSLKIAPLGQMGLKQGTSKGPDFPQMQSLLLAQFTVGHKKGAAAQTRIKNQTAPSSVSGWGEAQLIFSLRLACCRDVCRPILRLVSASCC